MPITVSGGGGTVAGTLLGVTQYAPASLATYTFASTTLAAVDATNLTLAVTVPASGNLLVRFEGYVTLTPAGTFALGLLNHSGGAQLGNTIEMTNSTSLLRMNASWYLTGLTPGALGIDIAAAATAGTTGKIFAQGHTGVVVGADAGPAILIAWAA